MKKYIFKNDRSCPTRKSVSWCFVALLEPHSDDFYINVHCTVSLLHPSEIRGAGSLKMDLCNAATLFFLLVR
jgi:hypothetical protein